MTLQFGASLTDDTRSINYDRNVFIIQATEVGLLNKSSHLVAALAVTKFIPTNLVTLCCAPKVPNRMFNKPVAGSSN